MTSKLRVPVAVLLLEGAWATAACAESYVVFDVPGYSFNQANALNANGDIVGSVFPPGGGTVGFERTAAGAFTVFGNAAQDVSATDINSSGTIVGSTKRGGFVKPPGGRLGIVRPDHKSARAGVGQLNESGDYAVAYQSDDSTVNLYIQKASGEKLPIAMGCGFCGIGALNDEGVVGYELQILYPGLTPFIRTPDGTVTSFSVPSISTGQRLNKHERTYINQITNEGIAVGDVLTQGCSPSGCSTEAVRSFIRTPDGTVVAFQFIVDGNVLPDTSAIRMDVTGNILGTYHEGGGSNSIHGLLRSASGTVTVFDVPGMVSTNPTDMTAQGAVGGTCIDASNVSHGFIRLP